MSDEKSSRLEEFLETYVLKSLPLKIVHILATKNNDIVEIYPQDLFNAIYFENLSPFIIILFDGKKLVFRVIKSGKIEKRYDPYYMIAYYNPSAANKIPESVFIESIDGNDPKFKISEWRDYSDNSTQVYLNKAIRVIDRLQITESYMPTVLLIPFLKYLLSENTKVSIPRTTTTPPYKPNTKYIKETKWSHYGTKTIWKNKSDGYYLSTLALSEIVGITSSAFIIGGDEKFLKYDLSHKKFTQMKSSIKTENLVYNLDLILSILIRDFVLKYGIIPLDIGFGQIAVKRDGQDLKMFLIDIAPGVYLSHNQKILLEKTKESFIELLENDPYLLSCKKVLDEIICIGKNVSTYSKLDPDFKDLIIKRIMENIGEFKKRKDYMDSDSMEKIKEIAKGSLLTYRDVFKEINK